MKQVPGFDVKKEENIIKLSAIGKQLKNKNTVHKTIKNLF